MTLFPKSSEPLLQFKVHDRHKYFHLEARSSTYVPLDESWLCQHIPGFRSFNEKARDLAFKRFLKDTNIIDCGHLPKDLRNCKLPRDPRGHKTMPSQETLLTGAHKFLAVGGLFQNQQANFDLLADLLCGMWCKNLRVAEPEFQAVTVVDSRVPQIEVLLTALVQGVVTRKHWHRKGIKIHRAAVLDYRTSPWALPRHIQDFSCIKASVPKKGYKALRMPCCYTDTVVLVIGAESWQLREASPYLQDAAVFLLDCGGCAGLNGRRISASALNAYDPKILEMLQQERETISLFLACWWAHSSPKGARQIIQAARASFGPTDSRYIAVTLDPHKLRQAIRYQILLSFLHWLDTYELLTSEELSSFHAAVKQVYDPEPIPEQPVRHAEDPETFLEAMRTLAVQSPIAGLDEPIHKKDHHLGAWREISGTRYLVIEEGAWAKAYRQQVRKDKGIDATFFQKDGWERDMQKLLAERELIKVPSAGYRYRYDLYGVGKRDSTYVVAIPAALLDPA